MRVLRVFVGVVESWVSSGRGCRVGGLCISEWMGRIWLLRFVWVVVGDELDLIVVPILAH